MSSIFSKIIKGEIPCHKVAEDESFFAFLDISPLSKGHTLVIPKKEVDYIFDMQEEDLQKMMVFAQKVAKAIRLACPCKKVGMTVIGLEVPHAHIHLVPLNEVGEMDFKRAKVELSHEEFAAIANSITTSFLK